VTSNLLLQWLLDKDGVCAVGMDENFWQKCM
jgi:hypothetical protein